MEVSALKATNTKLFLPIIKISFKGKGKVFPVLQLSTTP
jgi:hypothetical protein